MAKGDTVYSLFGMKSPQQVAAEERERAMKYMTGQRTGYQQAGAGLGLLLGSLFGDSEEMKRAKEGEAIVTGARKEARQAEEAKAAELASFQQQLRKAGGRTTREGQPLIDLSAEEQLAKDQEKYYQLYNTIADRLDAAGFTTEAENARNKASQQLLGSLSIRKQLADIGYTEAKTQKELAPADFKNVGRYVDASGTPFQGGRRGNVIYNLSTGEAVPNAIAEKSSFGGATTTVPTVAQAGIAMPWINQDPMASELSKEDQGALAGWMAGKAQELLDQRQVADPNAAYQMALEMAKQQGLLRSEAPAEVPFIGLDIPGTGGPVFTLQPQAAPEQSLGDTPARDIAVPTGEPQASAADPEGSVRRYVGDRVALFDEKTKKFIRYVD